MSVRHTFAVGALAAGLLALPVASSQAAAPTSNCSQPNYPPNKPKLTLTLAPVTVTAGQNSTAMGQFTMQNGQCYVRGASIRIERRALVNAKPSGSWHTFKVVTTDSKGLYSSRISLLFNN